MDEYRSLNHAVWECKYHGFWARGCFVSTVGRDEQVIRQYIKKQEAEDRRFDQLNMFE